MIVALISVFVYIVIIVERWFLATTWQQAVLAVWDRDILEFFLTGMMLFGMGLLGEYIGRVYQQVRHRPRYLVEVILERKD